MATLWQLFKMLQKAIVAKFGQNVAKLVATENHFSCRVIINKKYIKDKYSEIKEKETQIKIIMINTQQPTVKSF